MIGASRLVMTTLGLLALAACAADPGSAGAPAGNVVNVYNWADYIAPDTIGKFEAEYGIRVNYDTYDGSEVAEVKLLAGGSGYDVVVLSGMFGARLVPLGIFERLDTTRLANIRNLDADIIARTNVNGQTSGYSVPYHWGTTGYSWNVEMVRERLPDHPMDSADVLFDPAVVSKLADCGVTLLDSPVDVFPAALAYLGRDPNAVDDESLAAAEALLKSVRPYIRYFSNQKMATDLPNKEICVAMGWSGDYAIAAARAEEAGIDIELRYTLPKEGSGLWSDNLHIPSDAPHRDNAYLFIDFLMRPEIAAEIADYVHYANANRASWQYMDPAVRDNPAVFPDPETWKILFPVLNVDPKRERLRTRAFARVKSGY